VTVNWILPLLAAFGAGWIVWHRWISQAVSMLFWALFLWPFTTSPFGVHEAPAPRFWVPLVCCIAVSPMLTELGVRLRDRYQGFLRRRFPRYFARPA
jgi:hypothetical protein